MRKSLDGRCSVVGIAQPFARSGNPARKRIKKILQLTHRVFSFTFPHCTAVGFRLNLGKMAASLTNNPSTLFRRCSRPGIDESSIPTTLSLLPLPSSLSVASTQHRATSSTPSETAPRHVASRQGLSFFEETKLHAKATQLPN